MTTSSHPFHITFLTIHNSDTMQKYTNAIFLFATIFFLPLSTYAQSSDDADPNETGVSNYTHSSPLNSCGLGSEIYCNGELVNSPGTGVGGVDESVLLNSTAPEMSAYGIACFGPNWRCADEFVVPAGLVFDVTNFVFYLYQSFETTLPTVNDFNLRIFSGGDPDTGTLLCGDTTTNLLNAASDADIYRVLETDIPGTVSTRRIQELEVAVPADCPAAFAAGTYWLDFQGGGTGSSGPWAPPIASALPPPATFKDVLGDSKSNLLEVTGNAMQSGQGAAYVPVLDDGSAEAQGFPFNIIGTQLPVELSLFEAISVGSSVNLKWETSSETNNAGFEIQQHFADGFEIVQFVEGKGTSLETNSYSYTISDLSAGRHQFRLKQIDYDGAYEFSDIVEVLVDVPEGFVVYKSYPNPFNPNTTLEFVVENDQRVDVALFDIFGKKIGTYFSSEVTANNTQRVNVNVGNLPSATYILKVTGQSFSHSQMVQLLK